MHAAGSQASWRGLDVIALGTHRVCVRDPMSPAHALKFERPPHERGAAGLRERVRRAAAWRLARLFGDNATEWRAYRALHARIGDALDAHVAACHGFVDTPHGQALRVACITGDDGAPAPSLFRLLDGGGAWSAEALCAAVDAMEAWLQRHRIPLFDLNAGNFVVVGPPAAPRLVCVDCKSVRAGKELVPLSRWIEPLRRRKVARRAERLRARIRAALAR